MTKLAPFYTDDKTAKAILAAAKDHQAQAQNGQVTGANTSDVTTQFQNTCQFKLTADWRELSPSNFVASGNKIVPLDAGAEKRLYSTTLYAYGTKPTSSKDSIIVATRRANRWVLLPTGNGEAAPSNQKVRLVQPKELFPACEYKTFQDVYDCELQYSDDNDEWTTVAYFDIDRWRQIEITPHLNPLPEGEGTNGHKYWRINLKGFSKPPVSNDPFADRGFYTYGQLWETVFWVKRHVEHESGDYTITADVSSWRINTNEPVPVEIKLTPSITNAELHYRAGSGEWENTGSFTNAATVSISTAEIAEHTSFQFKVVKNQQDVISVTVKKPTYTLSPNDAENAMPNPPNSSLLSPNSFFDSKPVPRKAGTHRYWCLTFDQPEVVTDVFLDVDRHHEHYIVCPGGRNAFKQDVKFIYSFDLVTETWTATTFPELQKPMFNMDAKVVELSDGTHQLMMLSGQTANGFSNIIQGYNFERDYIHNIVDFGDGGLNFAGRPAFVGKPVLPRYGYVSALSTSTLSSAIIIAGGGSRSVAIRGSTSAIDTSLFALRGETLELDRIYEVQTLNNNISLTGNTGLPFGMFDYTTQSSNAGAVGARLQAQGRYVRHQNLPVRGIMRQRPIGNTSQPSASNPVVDFLLIGGFNSVGNSEYNDTVVSGAFHSPTASAANSAQYQMRIGRLPNQGNNDSSFLYYPDCDRVLGDCCVEYIEGRDEVICFGGRAAETDTAIAWDSPAVLEFSPTPRWVYTKYPPMPHPRWSAASVLIKDLVRKWETEPCDRIFIIGGRNKDGFVAEVDVFNLQYNIWETDWKGLDQGELENYTASGTGGGTTIIVNGGGADCKAISAATVRQILEEAGFEVG